MNHFLTACTLVICVLFLACSSSRPKEVLSPKEMEAVLYDYHLATAVANSSDNTHRKEQKIKAYQYIFDKHGINQTVMDSSLTYYTRHTVQLAEILTHIQKRIKVKKDSITRLITLRDNRSSGAISGDTVNLWYHTPLLLLSPNLYRQYITFEMRKDSTYHIADSIAWHFTTQFLASHSAKKRAVAGLRILYKNDSVLYTEKRINKSASFAMSLFSNQDWEIKKIDGFVFLNNEDSTNTTLLLKELELLRFHRSIVPQKTEKKNQKKAKLKESPTQQINKESNQLILEQPKKSDHNKLHRDGIKMTRDTESKLDTNQLRINLK